MTTKPNTAVHTFINQDEEKRYGLYQSESNPNCFNLYRSLVNGGAGLIGYVYTHQGEYDVLYIATDLKGIPLAKPTTNFIALEADIERYLKQIQRSEIIDEYDQLLSYNYSLTQNSNPMKTNQKTTEHKKINQIIYTEYDRPGKGEPFITIKDSYNNHLGKIHRDFNQESGKYEYTLVDHSDSPIMKSEKAWELKAEISRNREEILNQAYQRRVAEKQLQKESVPSRSSSIAETRKEDIARVRKSKEDQTRSVEPPQVKLEREEKQSNINEWETEMDDINEDFEDSREDYDLEL